MSARRPNLAAAGADFAFALLALASGWAGAPVLYAGLVLIAAAAVWAWMRRAALRAMTRARLLTNTALALAMLAGVLGGAYWIGLVAGGHL